MGHLPLAERGHRNCFHESVRVRALNDVGNWGASDHCRLLIEVDD